MISLPLVACSRLARWSRAFVLVAIYVTLAAACGDGSSGTTPAAPAPTVIDPQATPFPADWPSDVSTLAELDFSTAPLVGELQRLSNGGAVEQQRVALFDLVGADDVLEAIVFVESGGTLGDIGIAVYRLIDGRPMLLTYIEAAGRAEFEDDLELLFTFEGVYREGDAECCPSTLREVAYGWDGERFAVVSDQLIDNPER